MYAVTLLAAQGLSSNEAARRLAEVGPNAVAEPHISPFIKVGRRLWEPVPWMLEAAIVLQLAIGERIEAFIIAALLGFNVALGVFQEGRASAALAALKAKLALKAFVKRDGQWVVIPAAELVPGDVVKLALGGIVPADSRIMDGTVLLDQSMLTGESIAVEAGPGKTAYAGALVRRGAATAEITATGQRTYFGKTAELVRIAHAESGEQKAVLGVVRNLAIFNGGIVVLLVAYAHSIAMPAEDVIPLVLTALLASIPVALPATFTLAAALSAQVLTRKKVLLTRLSAIHEAATLDVLCADKTGTLTRNELKVTAVKPLKEGLTGSDVLALAALASSDSGQDPVDTAIRAAVKGHPFAGTNVRKFMPFDPATKVAEALIADASGNEQRVIKGAPAVVGQIAPLGPMAPAELETLTQHGYRVLAVASGTPQQVEIIGLIGLSDPPRADSKELLTALRSMGVHTVMVTGDAAATAATVAAAVGLEGRVCPPGAIPDSAGPEDFAVYAGVFPEDKFRLVKAFQRKKHTVGMCGDGVNDAPALRQAQMGIAVSTATDVAKSAASMVLMEPGLGGIVTAIKEGRAAFQRILTYTLNALAKKFQLVLFLGAGLIMTGHAVLTPMLMALLLITGDFITMSLATDRATPSPMPDAWRIPNITGAAAILGLMDLVFSTGVIAAGKNRLGLNVAELQTLAFVTIVFAGQATVYVARERGRMWHSRPGCWLLLSSFLDLGIAILLATTGILMRPLPARVIGQVFVATILFSFVLDSVKFAAFKRLKLVEKAASYEPALAPPGGRIQPAGTQRPGETGSREVGLGGKAARSIAMGAIIVLVFAGGWLYWSLPRGAATHYITERVERGPVVRMVTARGTVTPATSVAVRAHVSGVIEALYCSRGMKVTKGQLCAKIDPRPYQLSAGQERAGLAAAKSRLDKDKASLAQVKSIFERNRALAKRRAISRKVLGESRKIYEEAQARTKLDEVLVNERRAALETAETILGDTSIVSPVGGMVVSRNIELGQMVEPGSETPLFDIASVTSMRADVTVGEKDIGEVKPGDKATLTVASLPERRFAGEVTQIRQSPETFEHAAAYDVVISVHNPDLLLEPGMTVEISIVVGRRDDVLRVPDRALHFSPGRASLTGAAGPNTLPSGWSRLWILRDGKASAIMVQPGLDDGAYTEIVKGDLRAGDELIIGGSDDAK